MAGFEAFSDGAWAPVVPATRQALDWKGRRLFTPSAAEQAAICRRFGRPKDLARVALLEALTYMIASMPASIATPSRGRIHNSRRPSASPSPPASAPP